MHQPAKLEFFLELDNDKELEIAGEHYSLNLSPDGNPGMVN
ncbi:MAG: hypothetical protein PWQ17_1334 [Anaerophaga sp.]|nr:hypothetical protein [Anaerophaga sp.]MDK2841829.1 hypothetical protein [Anaerophaga sp.]MDN5292170.1 hypothetical protein [Anaerophaga sp.]